MAAARSEIGDEVGENFRLEDDRATRSGALVSGAFSSISMRSREPFRMTALGPMASPSALGFKAFSQRSVMAHRPTPGPYTATLSEQC